MLDDAEMNKAFKDFKQAEHIRETFHARSRKIQEKRMFGKLRPQIFLAIVVLGILSSLGVMYEYNEIATGCVGGIIALGMKVLESE